MIWRKYEARVGSCGGNANLANIHLPCGNVFPNFLAPLIRVCGLDCWSQGSFEGSLIAFSYAFLEEEEEDSLYRTLYRTF